MAFIAICSFVACLIESGNQHAARPLKYGSQNTQIRPYDYLYLASQYLILLAAICGTIVAIRSLHSLNNSVTAANIQAQAATTQAQASPVSLPARIPDQGRGATLAIAVTARATCYREVFEVLHPRVFTDPMVAGGTSVEMARGMGIEAHGLSTRACLIRYRRIIKVRAYDHPASAGFRKANSSWGLKWPEL